MKRKSFIALLLGGLLALSGSGCSKKGNQNRAEVDLEISFWQSGFGIDYMNRIVTEFGKKYPEYNIQLNPNTNMHQLTQTLNNPKSDTVDLYFSSVDSLLPYTDSFAELDDVYAAKAEGEDVTIGSKFQSGVKDVLKNEEGNYFAISYAGGISGIVYHSDIIKDDELPRTSDELRYLALDVANNRGVKAFIHYKDNGTGYYDALFRVWMAQYGGLDYYNEHFIKLTDQDGNTPSKEVYTSETDGRKAALEAFETIVNPTTTYASSNNIEYTPAQTYFLNKRSAMMMNGSWLRNEMSSSASAQNASLKMMKIPVISSIIDVLPDKSVEDDEELSALIEAIDAGETATKGSGYEVTQKDFDRVKEARSLGYYNANEHIAVINKYSNSPNAAKKFLEFYFSEAGGRIFAETIRQYPSFSISETNLDVSEWTDFEKSCYDYTKNITILNNGGFSRSKVFLRTDIGLFGQVEVLTKMTAVNDKDRKDSAAIWKEFNEKVEKNWSSWLFNAGYEN